MGDTHPEPLAVDSRGGNSSWGAVSSLDLVMTNVPGGAGATIAPVEPPKSVLRRLTPPDATPAADENLDRYEVKQEVGRGGMGRVLVARDQDLNRDVAMKVLLQKEASTAQLHRFIEEAQITGQLEHPNVLPVHDFGVNADGDPFFTMKFVKGHTTLEEVIDKLRDGDVATHRLFTFERRVQVIQQVCHALAYAHQRGVVHRDLKPSNIVLGTCGEVFLVDWGVAKLAGERAAPGIAPPETLRKQSDRFDTTREGEWLGTPAYMAPEQVIGHQHEVDARSDLYSLTAVLYELLCLHYYLGPVGGKLGDLVAAILQRRPADAEDFKHALNGRVPRILSRICRKGLEKRPEARYQTAQELEAALQGWLEGNTPVVCPGTAIKRGLTRWSTLIDDYPVLVPAASIGTVVVLLGWIVASVWFLARGA